MHTFLHQPGEWLATGRFLDAQGNSVVVTGGSRIQHSDEVWTNSSWMHIEDGPTIRMTYEVQPFKDRLVTPWTSVNSALGRFLGSFTVVGDAILNSGATHDGMHSVVEFMLLDTPEKYTNRGALLRSGMLVSAWELDLTRRA